MADVSVARADGLHALAGRWQAFGQWWLSELRQLVPPDEGAPIGSITYYLDLPLRLTTDKLSERVMRSDTANIEGIQWSKSKNASDIYQ